MLSIMLAIAKVCDLLAVWLINFTVGFWPLSLSLQVFHLFQVRDYWS
jgi:hypothetical protein